MMKKKKFLTGFMTRTHKSLLDGFSVVIEITLKVVMLSIYI